MRFVILGSGTTIPTVDRGPAGFLLDAGGARVLVDGGSGTLQRLARAGVDARELDGGVYSHRHLDHCGDLAPLLFTLRVGADLERERDYPIWAGEGFQSYLESMQALHKGWLQGDDWQPIVTELPLDGVGHAELPGGTSLTTRPARHTQGALHLRFDRPEGTVVFSGDTGPSDGLVELASGVDVLICECAEAEPTERLDHMWPEAVAELVEASRPKRVLLTHFYPEADPERALKLVGATGVPTERATDGQVVTL